MTSPTKPPLRTGGSAWGPQRVALGVSIRRLADLSGVDKAYLSLAENGRYIPTGEQYRAVMDALASVERQEATA